MDKILYVLPALVCPLGMGAAMWFMMRGGGMNRGQQPQSPDPHAAELTALRAQVADLREQVHQPDAAPAGERP
jgi:hypothetical protein